MRRIRVLHLPTDTGGNSWGLAQGERALGLDCTVMVFNRNWMNWPTDIDLNIREPDRDIPGQRMKLFRTFLSIRNKYDIFHFNFGSSLINIPEHCLYNFDMPFYSGRSRLFVTYNGCDARQKFKTLERVKFSACHNDKCYNGICNSGFLDEVKETKIDQVRRYAYQIFALNPDLLWVLPNSARFLPYTVACWNNIETLEWRLNKKLKILHAPTDRGAKGSDIILKALDNLMKKYENDIEMILIENMSNAEALSAYREADLVIDQVLVGWYGGLSVEVMKMGKPVAVFLREEDLRFLPKNMAKDLKEAVINIDPFNIEEVLEEYVHNPHLLHAKSKACIDYVNRWHAPEYVAGITKSLYEESL